MTSLPSRKAREDVGVTVLAVRIPAVEQLVLLPFSEAHLLIDHRLPSAWVGERRPLHRRPVGRRPALRPTALAVIGTRRAKNCRNSFRPGPGVLHPVPVETSTETICGTTEQRFPAGARPTSARWSCRRTPRACRPATILASRGSSQASTRCAGSPGRPRGSDRC